VPDRRRGNTLVLQVEGCVGKLVTSPLNNSGYLYNSQKQSMLQCVDAVMYVSRGDHSDLYL
jgi:hypothetical protein